MIKIRTAKPEHRKFLLRLFCSLNNIVNVWLKYRNLSIIDEIIKNRQVKIAIDDNNVVIGAIVLVPRRESIYIGALIVKASKRRMGVGRKLIKETIRKAKRQKKKYISVETAFGYKARGFYEKCGFYRTKTFSDCWSLSYKC